MYELIFRNLEGDEIEYSVNVTFGSSIPEIPDNMANWSQIPQYPVSMIYSNGTELNNLSKFIPRFSYTLLPVGNWNLLSSLANTELNNSIYFSIDNVDSDYWGYTDRWEENESRYRYSYSFTYYKDTGLIFVASFWVHDKYAGGNSLWSVHFTRDFGFNSPLPAIYTTYTIISFGSLAVILIWIRRTNRF
ncbi:MAG: hypothetical protein ACXADL_15615 [Candidatus Thorarchaeota archaeon]|jgi:hypothetical protein